MKYIAYYRVSTKEQGKSGLGIDAQKTSVHSFAKDAILAEFTEVESGKNDNRTELKKAIQLAQTTNSTLIIAKIDRLSRNLTFISNLMDSKVKFLAVDMPEANEFTIHIFAALAQQERKVISTRTKSALAEKKKQGVKLGKPENFTNYARLKGNAVCTEKSRANENNKKAGAMAKLLFNNGLNFSQIANELNKNGFKTAKNSTFQAIQVQRIMQKFTA
jgi:DNA invertase Pin-like site-specific DNA recombinase